MCKYVLSQRAHASTAQAQLYRPFHREENTSQMESRTLTPGGPFSSFIWPSFGAICLLLHFSGSTWPGAVAAEHCVFGCRVQRGSCLGLRNGAVGTALREEAPGGSL